ncbi:DUF1003 domain-containing protein [Hyphomonas sp.]|jgi:uncharacterized membrane protein|uniref:DUF1003 domain-containing protein n=1 Tax=Hyphomonas sp. TaxID=87 RepID=UPI0025BA6E14|nr:DUF1003 domain-containing protein [Hyphomonas sp.]
MIIEAVVSLVNTVLHRTGNAGKAEQAVDAFRSRRPLVPDANAKIDAETSQGDRLSDAIARIGGSWPFITGFVLFLILWIVGNGVLLGTQDRFDPYPFIFLNLVLSMVAALQAPIIMMSQNRQSAKDRLVANTDYEVNLKAELEILALHEKIDRLEAQQAAMLAHLSAMRGAPG